MRSFGHSWLVILVVCLGVMPARTEGAAITIPLGSVGDGAFDFSGTFTTDNDVALIAFSLATTAFITAEITSHQDDPAGFDPVLTLFGPGTDFLGTFERLADSATGLLDSMLSPGDYILALTQYNNFYVDGEDRFDYDAATGGLFTKDLFDSGNVLTCGQFVAFDFETSTPECRSGNFAGTLSVESVPEPGSVLLLSVGGAAALARRRCRGGPARRRQIVPER